MEFMKTKMLSASIEVIGKQYNLEPNNICHIGSQRPELPNDILIEHQSIKTTHAAVTNFDGSWYIISRTGKDTYVNGIEITRCPVKLNHEDKIKFGDIEAQFSLNKEIEVTNESSGYEDVISPSPELLSRRHLIFKSNDKEETCDNVIDTTCDDSFEINATENNLNISNENDEMCFIPETQALPTYTDKSNLEGGFGEVMDLDESQFCINSEGFKDFGENDINNSMNEALTSLVIPYIHHDTVMLFDEKSADNNVLNSAEQSLSDISKNCGGKRIETDASDKLNLSTTNKIGETNNIDEREGSCTPDLFDEIITCQQKSPSSENEESNANLLSHHSPPVNENNLLPTQKFKYDTLDENGLTSNISQKENKEPKKSVADYSGLEPTQIFSEPDLETPKFFRSKYIKPKELPQFEILNKTETVNNNSNDINHDEWLDRVNRPKISTDFIELLKSPKANTSKNTKVCNPSTTIEKKLCVDIKEVDKKEKSISKNLNPTYGKTSSDSETSSYSNDDKNEYKPKEYLKRISDDSLISGGKKRRISNSSQDKSKSSSEQSDASNRLNKNEKILNCKVNVKKSILSIEVSAIESKLDKQSKRLDTSKLKHKDHKKIRSTSKEETKHSVPPKPQLVKKDEKNSAAKISKPHDLKKRKVSTDKNASKSNEKEILNTSKDEKKVTHSNKTKRTTTEVTEGQAIEKKSRRSARNPKSHETKQKAMSTSTPLDEKRRSTRLASEIEAQIPNATPMKKVDKESPGKHAVKKKIASKPISKEPAATDKRNTKHNVSKHKTPPKAEVSNSKDAAAKVTKAQPTKKLVSEELALPRRTTRLMSLKSTEDKEEDVKKKSNKSERGASTSKEEEVSKEQKKEKPPILVSFSTIDLSDIQYLKHQSNNLWNEADHVKNCDVLIMNKASRTIKFLIAIARGIPIVTLDWLSKKYANSHDLSNCMLEDKEFERKYNFKLLNVLAKSHKAKLFKGYEFSMTEHISPGNKDMQDLLSCTGAIVHTTVSPNTNKKNIKAMYLISSEKDKNIWEHCTKHNSKLHVVSTEGVMLAVMHQDVIYLDIHSLK